MGSAGPIPFCHIDALCNAKPEQVYHRTRGPELPGNNNYAFLAELFHVQSSRWASIARDHINVVSKVVSRFVDSALTYEIQDAKVRENVRRLIGTKLETNVEAGKEELASLLDDEARQPITYNHYYIDNIQKARDNSSKIRLERSLYDAIKNDWNGSFHLENTQRDTERLLVSLKKRVIVDMKEQACSDAQTDFAAYYKVCASQS